MGNTSITHIGSHKCTNYMHADKTIQLSHMLGCFPLQLSKNMHTFSLSISQLLQFSLMPLWHLIWLCCYFDIRRPQWQVMDNYHQVIPIYHQAQKMPITLNNQYPDSYSSLEYEFLTVCLLSVLSPLRHLKRQRYCGIVVFNPLRCFSSYSRL